MANILIVEDDKTLQLIMHKRLTSKGHQITIAENGQQGVEKALTGNYDAVLMDMYMPILNGSEAVIQLRQQNYHGLIIGVSASNTPKDKKQALAIGCDQYIIKPFPENFEHLVEVFIHTFDKDKTS